MVARQLNPWGNDLLVLDRAIGTTVAETSKGVLNGHEVDPFRILYGDAAISERNASKLDADERYKRSVGFYGADGPRACIRLYGGFTKETIV